MKITKREILASVTIIAIMILVGFVIVGRIDAYQVQKNSEYYSALQITDAEQFQYGMDTSVGNAFVYGTLEAADPVTYPEIGGEYLYVEKVEEHYTMHTRTVTTTDSKGNHHTHTEVYWTWDYAGSENVHSNRIKFLGIEMDYKRIQRPDAHYIDTIKKSSNVRFQYYATPAKCAGTIYTDLRDGTISENSRFFDDVGIDTAIKRLTSSRTWLFWIVWILVTGGAVYGFYYLDNDWLNT